MRSLLLCASALAILFVVSSAESSYFHEDALVPETAFTSSAYHSKNIDTATETLKLKICAAGHECTYNVKLQSTSSESDNGKESSQSDELTQSFQIHVKPAGAENTFTIDGSDYAVGGSQITADASEFNECFARSIRHVTQHPDTGEIDLMEEHSVATEDRPCSQYEQKIQSIYAGTVEALAGVYAHATDTELLEFSETVNVGNARRTTHYRREEHTDGTMTIHRKRSWQADQSSHPMPMLMQASDTALGATATGTTHTNADGETDSAKDHVSANLGGGDSNADFGCTGSSEADANGQSCNNDEVPKDKNQEQTVRLKSETDYVVELVSSVASNLVQTMTMDEFLQFHAKAGRRPVPLLEAITVPEEAIENPSDEQMAQGYDKFVQTMVQLGNAKPESFEPGKVRERVQAAMKSPKVRARMVRDLSQNKIKSTRFVQSLMHAIGVAGTKQPEAIDQLIELASTPGIDEDAAMQALVALLQAQCYDHDHAIQGLSKLARPNPQSHLEITALHIQHGLMAHADHCANHKYTEASARKYQDILVQTRKHLAQAVANGDDASAWILMDAIGNTHSQHPAETAALVEVANNGHMTKQTELIAVKNLGKLYTPEALVALKELASHPILENKPLKRAVEKAIAGDHLVKGDYRKPPVAQVTSLAQTGGGNFGLDRSKVWSFPSTGDLRAEPKIGIEISKEDDYADSGRNPLCLHGYAGVDGKAWTWTISLVQAGARKCVGFKFYAYFSILSVTIWNKEKGSGRSNGGGIGTTGDAGQQFSTAGDSNGHCQTNVDAMDLTVVLSFDKDFLDANKSIWIGIFCLNGRIKLTGEVGLKCGWGNMGDPNSANSAPECRGGEILFAIPYAQATLTGELALDVLIAKGGAGVNVILVKFSLPSTNENMPPTATTAQKDCGGTYLKVESLGGAVYAFVDVVCGISWFFSRDWCRKYTVTLYEWSSPTDWTSNDVTCKTTGQAPTTQASSDETPAAAATVSADVSQTGSDTVQNSASVDEAIGAGAYAGQSKWVNAQKYPGRCGSNFENQICGKGGTGCVTTHGVEVCEAFDCDQFRYCSSSGWCGRQSYYNAYPAYQCKGS